jgi:hypothetical protein
VNNTKLRAVHVAQREIVNKYSSASVRQFCAHFLDKEEIADTTWRDWKSRAGCVGRVDYYSYDQVLSLAAIADFRSRNPLKPITDWELTLSRQRVAPILRDCLKSMDREKLVMGRDIAWLMGIDPQKKPAFTQALYRRIKNFSYRKKYTHDFVYQKMSDFLDKIP